ncbi:MAG TPA: 1-acyl-sn-glycerol-3-phosphate acyltransferase [Citreicella sp.]|jgi:1-acyl-sn-glycerol-3-phosphate acyltransferase|uniref:1-acyl-sn-glycerol-3-phosphate acyltransferase n=1 Tax=Salipiger marinus TaxID=555512 RepID=A0A1G8LES8_9RHOB|nr:MULTISPECIES: lysophospholipid acyltransferase family protein [Salipiger]MCD1619813.1 1-acyl-sn-glycerol-3-phosphate acyltransferase [Salipiger manganoxidans]SDI54222.1 1-acyl-sn-glycerol-3-phosphate acyltransferase [Salipiger marinus]HBM60490.1 1-acyl-sn-glycerol-3-phosphate acyltransferase [Citreicella sp.]HBT01207.1 1-acyl-sn-glycerol-3-phosphate acyltransferase [Citreicella sp.]
MRDALQWVRSVLFIVQMYLMMAVIGLGCFPWALVSRRGARFACISWCRWVRWSASWMVGLRSEVRGTPPKGEVIIAAKHQSFFDIIMIFSAVPAAKFIMKRELLWTPVLGQYAMRIGCVAVDRSKRGAAIGQMLTQVKKGLVRPGQLIIYPQGTRVAPGVKLPYRVGAALLYGQTGQTCVPAATNVGLFWPRRGILRKPGLAVVEFLPPLAPGLSKSEFLSRLEQEIEPASDRLMAEAGFYAQD